MSVWGILAAGGAGERLGAGVPKAFAPLLPGGTTMFAASLRVMLDPAAALSGVVAAVPEGWEAAAKEAAAGLGVEVVVVAGGPTRQSSVAAALAAVPPDASAVVVHDAARPWASPRGFAAVVAAVTGAQGPDGAVLAIPVADTIKRADGRRVTATVSRADLWRAQTPQAFRAAALRDAHARAAREGSEATDDAELVERAGGTVRLVDGDAANVKVTTAGDVPAEVRAGTGYDAHALVPGRPLMLGGVQIPSERGLDGHSDADVLCHAIADAVLGAARAGDLGTHFPSHDERWRNAAGTTLLAEAAALLSAAGFTVRHVDATLAIQSPAIAPHRDAIAAAVGGALGIEPDRVNIKATTTDGLGVVGDGAGAAAHAVVVCASGGAPEISLPSQV